MGRDKKVLLRGNVRFEGRTCKPEEGNGGLSASLMCRLDVDPWQEERKQLICHVIVLAHFFFTRNSF